LSDWGVGSREDRCITDLSGGESNAGAGSGESFRHPAQRAKRSRPTGAVVQAAARDVIMCSARRTLCGRTSLGRDMKLTAEPGAFESLAEEAVLAACALAEAAAPSRWSTSAVEDMAAALRPGLRTRSA
jgi:hypothetical protein